MSARWTADDDQKLIDTLDAVVRERPVHGGTAVVSQVGARDIGSFRLGGEKVCDMVGERIGRSGAAVASRLRKLDNGYTCPTTGTRWMHVTKPRGEVSA